MKALVITKHNPNYAFEHERVVQEAIGLGVEVDTFFYEDFSLYFDEEGLKIWHKGILIDFSLYHWVYWRSSQISEKISLSNLKTVLLSVMLEKKVRVLNGASFDRWPLLSKLVQHYYFSLHGISTVKTSYLEQHDENWTFPVISKIINGNMGRGVEKIKTAEELKLAKQKYGIHKLLVQEYLPGLEDFRILILGGKVLGAIRRRAPEGSHLTNVSAGGVAESVEPTSQQAELALSCARVFDLDYAGVDIMYDRDGVPLVLEVNRHAQFQGFEKATGINVARSTVEFLVGETKAYR